MVESISPHQDILEKFREMIRDRYSIVEEAVFFIENSVFQSGINTSITNQRDVLSHYSSLLKNPSMSRDDALHHLGEAEGHMRRAIVDPYNQAISILSQQVMEVTNSYKKIVLPLLPNNNLPSAPDLRMINSTWEDVRKLRKESRLAKGKNSWAGADASVKCSLLAYQKLQALREKLEYNIPIAIQISNNRKNKVIQYWAIAITIIALILAILQLNK